MVAPAGVAPSSRRWIGIARELVAGSPLQPVLTIPSDAKSLSPEDTPKFLPDTAIRGSMAELYGQIIGPEDATFSFGGPAFLDSQGYWFDNIFGDMSTTGTSSGTGATTFSGSPAIGATGMTVAGTTGFTVGQNVQVDSGGIAEVVTLTTVAAGSLGFTGNPLRFGHGASGTVFGVVAPYVHKFALLNSQLGYTGLPGAQPPTHSVTDNTGLTYAGSPDTNTSFARIYPSACLSALDLTGNAEQLLDLKVSGNSWLSAPAGTVPVNTVASGVPVAAWKSTVYIGGTASGNQVFTVAEWALNVKRQLQVIWTDSGQQNPYIIGRGQLGATGTMKFAGVSDESALNYMLNNTQPQVRIAASNGLSGANLLSVQVDAQVCAFTKAKVDGNEALIGFEDSFECVANSTNTGGSGGIAPATVTITNAIPNY